MAVKPKTVWRQVCDGEGKGLLHLVTSSEGNEVTTWSEPITHEEIGGYSWIGPTEDFLKQFRPATK